LLSVEPLDSNEPGYYSYTYPFRTLKILNCIFILLHRYQSSIVGVKTIVPPGKLRKKSRARN